MQPKSTPIDIPVPRADPGLKIIAVVFPQYPGLVRCQRKSYHLRVDDLVADLVTKLLDDDSLLYVTTRTHRIAVDISRGAQVYDDEAFLLAAEPYVATFRIEAHS